MVEQAIINSINETHAAAYGQWRVPVLIGVFGLPGTGKTETTHSLATRYPLLALSTDAIRLRYQLASGPVTIDVMYAVAAALLPRNAGIIFDGIHMRRVDRLRLRQFAADSHADCAFIHTIANSAVIEERLEERRRNTEQTRAEGKFVIAPDHFARIASWLEAPTDEEGIWQVDTSANRHSLQSGIVDQWLSIRLEACDP